VKILSKIWVISKENLKQIWIEFLAGFYLGFVLKAKNDKINIDKYNKNVNGVYLFKN
jgi:hypothetical protein